MLPVDDFLAAYPQYTDATDHDLTIARINAEHEARKSLEEQRLGLLKKKLALERETMGKKEELARLDLEIERWLAGQGRVVEIFKKREEKVAKEATGKGEV